MVKCPKCGSTAQIRPVSGYHYNSNNIAEEYECGCGARLIRHYKLQVSILYTEEGAKFIREDE